MRNSNELELSFRSAGSTKHANKHRYELARNLENGPAASSKVLTAAKGPNSWHSVDGNRLRSASNLPVSFPSPKDRGGKTRKRHTCRYRSCTEVKTPSRFCLGRSGAGYSVLPGCAVQQTSSRHLWPHRSVAQIVWRAWCSHTASPTDACCRRRSKSESWFDGAGLGLHRIGARSAARPCRRCLLQLASNPCKNENVPMSHTKKWTKSVTLPLERSALSE